MSDWIDIKKKRKPENGQDVLVTYRFKGEDKRRVGKATYFDDDVQKGFWIGDEDLQGALRQVLAWMPMLEPYKGEQNAN